MNFVGSLLNKFLFAQPGESKFIPRSLSRFWKWLKHTICLLKIKWILQSKITLRNIPYAHHYNPRHVYFLLHFSLRFIIKSGFKSRVGYNCACMVSKNYQSCNPEIEKPQRNGYVVYCFQLSTYHYQVSTYYSRVHITSDTAFFKILKKPSIVQK
jgi:hypothetical protein